MKRTFIYTDAKSNKFWSIEVSADATAYTVTYGKVGAAGQTTEKSFPDAVACKKAVDKLIAEKTGKGYVEQTESAGVSTAESINPGCQPVASAATKTTGAPLTLLPPKTTRLRTLLSIPMPHKVIRVDSLDATSICAFLEIKKNESYEFAFCDINGVQKRIPFKFELSLSAPHINKSGLHICIDKILYHYSNTGELLSKSDGSGEFATKFSISPNGTVYHATDQAIKRITNGTVEQVATMSDAISYSPYMLSDEDMLVILKTTPRTLVHLSTDGKELWRTPLEGPNAYGVQPCGEGKVICMSKTHINLVDAWQKKHIAIPLTKNTPTGKACAAGADRAAYVSDDNTIPFVSWTGKTTASFLRQNIGEPKNSSSIATDGVSVFVPSLAKEVYRVAADGSCTGVCTLPDPLGENAKICATDDGIVVACDSKNCLHFIPDSAFVPGETPKPPVFLTRRAAELEKHFAPWTASNACKGIIKDLLARLVAERSKDGDMELDFLSTEGEPYTVVFKAPAPGRAPADFPESYRKATELHGSVLFDHGDAAGFCWFGDGHQEFDISYDDDFDFEPDKKGLYQSNHERYGEIGLAGQNCFIFDRGRTNKLGEPLMLFLSHEGGEFADARIFGGDTQKKTAYGIPGLIFRVIGHYVLVDDSRFEDCDMG